MASAISTHGIRPLNVAPIYLRMLSTLAKEDCFPSHDRFLPVCDVGQELERQLSSVQQLE